MRLRLHHRHIPLFRPITHSIHRITPITAAAHRHPVSHHHHRRHSSNSHYTSVNHNDDHSSSGLKKTLLVLLSLSLGLGLGFYGLAPRVVGYFGPVEDDDDDDDEDEKKPLSGTTVDDDDEKRETSSSSTSTASTSSSSSEEEEEEEPINESPSVFRDYEQRFQKFANETNPETGEKLMTMDAFIKSLVSAKGTGRPSEPSWIAYPRDPESGQLLVDANLRRSDSLAMMFSMADANADGLISFAEYSTFLTLLTSTKDQFRIAFDLFDRDGNGSIDLEEFKAVITSNNKDRRAQIDFDNNGIVRFFFGPPGSWQRQHKKLSFHEFAQFLGMFKDEILRQEFAVHDVEGNGLISVESFSELMTGNVHFNSVRVPAFKRNLNLLKTRGYLAPTGRIDFETFRAFHEMSQYVDDIGLAIQLYTRDNKKLDKTAFKHVIKRVVHLDIPDKAIDLAFAAFDTNGDNHLEYDEFMKVMTNRSNVEYAKY